MKRMSVAVISILAARISTQVSNRRQSQTFLLNLQNKTLASPTVLKSEKLTK